MPVTVWRAEVDDWQDLRFIRLKALRSDPSVFGSNHAKESAMSEADWKGWLQSCDTAIYLLRENDVPIGMTGIAVDRYDPTKTTAILWGSWLEPHARGNGLSKIMYERRIEWAKQHPSIETIIVSHRASNAVSRRANQKHGFEYIRSERKVWPDGTEEDDIFYALHVRTPVGRAPE